MHIFCDNLSRNSCIHEQSNLDCPYTIVNVLLFFFAMLAAKLGPLSSKNYSLTTRGEKERRIGGKWPRLSVTNCRVHRCIQVLTFLFQTKCLKFLYFVPESFKSLLFMLIFSYFSHELFWKMAETYVYMYVWELNHWGSPLSGDRDNSTFWKRKYLVQFLYYYRMCSSICLHKFFIFWVA